MKRLDKEEMTVGMRNQERGEKWYNQETRLLPLYIYLMDGQTHTELGCSIHCSHLVYCFKLYFLISVTSFHLYGG